MFKWCSESIDATLHETPSGTVDVKPRKPVPLRSVHAVLSTLLTSASADSALGFCVAYLFAAELLLFPLASTNTSDRSLLGDSMHHGVLAGGITVYLT